MWHSTVIYTHRHSDHSILPIRYASFAEAYLQHLIARLIDLLHGYSVCLQISLDESMNLMSWIYTQLEVNAAFFDHIQNICFKVTLYLYNIKSISPIFFVFINIAIISRQDRFNRTAVMTVIIFKIINVVPQNVAIILSYKLINLIKIVMCHL